MKISIRWALILGFLVLLWGTQIISTSSTYLSSQAVLIRHARDIMQNIADLTMEQSENHLALAQGAAHLTKRLMASNVVGSERNRQDLLERYFLDQLAIYPHFAGIYFGSPEGDFFYVSRSEARSANGFRTKIIKHNGENRETCLIWRDEQLRKLFEEFDPKDTYDPRSRPWYQKARDQQAIVWTDPYIFFTSQKPGITIAGPVSTPDAQLQGIVGVDIEIDQLSAFIGKLRIGKNGHAFMINNNGDVVAFSDISKLKVSEDGKNGAIRLVKIEELEDGLSVAAYRAISWQHTPDGRLELDKATFARFEYDGQPYHAMFTPFRNEKWPWIIAVYVPESDYLGSIKENRKDSIWVTLGLSGLVTLIGLWLASGIIRPLAELEKEALAINQHDLNQTSNINSPYSEIQETADAFGRMKASLLSSEEKYRQIFENIQDVYYEASLGGDILEISPSIENVSGYQRGDLIGKSFKHFYVDPQQRESFMRAILADGKVSNYELVMRNKGGDTEYCSVTASVKSDAAGHPLKIVGSLRIITQRKKADLELQRYRDHLEELVSERTRDLEKSNQQLIAEMEKRKQEEAQKKKLEERFQQIDRLEGIGTLAGGVAHDFNNLLMGIQGNVSLMLLGMDEQHAFRDKLKSIEACVGAGSKLTKQLLGFARGGKYFVKPIDFNQIVQDTVQMFGNTRKEITIIEDMQQGVWSVMADQGQIEQVLLNIYVNAWQAMPGGGELRVATENMALDESAVKSLDIKPGKYVRISITDTGIGMDEATQKRIFEPFFTTKEIGRGTGLGLASVYGIVKNHDGTVDFYSEVGRGTTFYVYLPASEAMAQPDADDDQNIRDGRETILLVDDEQVVLDVNKPMLETLGYKVLLAHGGKESLEIFSRAGDEIDMVILDMIMPDLGGGEVFDYLKQIRPDIRVLLSSGYSLSGEAEEILARGCTGFIQKPYNLEQLSIKIRQIMKL